MYTKLKKAKNTQENSRATNYFVIDIDSEYIIDKNLINKICFYLYNNNIVMPLPTAIISSGGGIHLYYKFKEIYIYNCKEKDYLLKLYKTAIETTKQAINNELENIKKLKPGYFTEKELFKIKTLAIDNALAGSTTQLIRLIGSYNKDAEKYCNIVDFNKNNTYTLGQLIEEFNPKYTIKNPIKRKNFKILSEKEFKEKNKIIKLNPNGFNKKDIIELNNGRLEDIKKLINLRKQEGTLVGTRQKIMCQVAWCLINNSYNGAKINILQELLDYGKLIGEEFAKEKYCREKLNHIKEYHKKRNKLTNNTISKWLELTEEEKFKLPNLWVTERSKRKIKKILKQQRINKIRTDFKNGKTVTELAKKYKISRTTIYKYISSDRNTAKKERGSTLYRYKNWTLFKDKKGQKKLLKAKKDTDKIKKEVFEMLVNGQTMQEIATELEVNRSTIYRWLKEKNVKKKE
ncbi:helix-turn-helix domain-containing protein [Anaerococcus porci]|nr:helix-turn-helix domain-containing protein [Anaerococcus porci]